MSARSSEASRVQDILDVVGETLDDIAASGMTRNNFLYPQTPLDKLASEGVVNRIFRITEELCHLDDVAIEYGLPVRQARHVRNLMAHVYAQVDMAAVWAMIEEDLPAIQNGAKSYARVLGIEPGY